MSFHDNLRAGNVTLARMQFTDNAGQPYTRAVVIMGVWGDKVLVRFAHTPRWRGYFDVSISALHEF